MEKEKVNFVKQGKLNRASGARFELKVRDILEKDGFVVDKWTNNIDLIERKLVKAKRKYNPFMKALSVGTGFPDFICFKRAGELFDIIGVEVKKRGYLDKEEKEKAKIYLEQKIFNKFLIAEPKKDGKRGEVSLVSFEEKYLSKI